MASDSAWAQGGDSAGWGSDASGAKTPSMRGWMSAPWGAHQPGTPRTSLGAALLPALLLPLLLLPVLSGCGSKPQPILIAFANMGAVAVDNGLSVAEDTSETDPDAGGAAPEEVSPETTADADSGEAVHAESCLKWAAPVEKGPLGAADLSEASGLAASRRLPGVLWSHNDSGEELTRVFALGQDGSHRATLVVADLKPDDTEDIALGPCTPPAAMMDCIYLADTGDNSHKRKVVEILRINEPDALPGLGGEIAGEGLQVHRFRYPKRPDLDGDAKTFAEHPDVEAMVVLADGRVVLFDKREDGKSAVFRAPLTLGTVATAEALGTLDLSHGALKKGPSLRTSAADLSGDGKRLLIRTYFRLFELDVEGALALPGADVVAALPALSANKRSIAHGFDKQGESVAYDPAGGIWHVSEGVGAPLFFIGCAP